jgi:hypothetical protein
MGIAVWACTLFKLTSSNNMDILSHGLYGGVAFGRQSRKSFWLSFFFGVAPDFFSFGLYTIMSFLGMTNHPSFASGHHPDPSQIPEYVHVLYNLTHSLVLFSLVFGVVWLIRKKPLWEMAGFGLHILVDIPTHSSQFFPTPFLWPVSSFHIDGHSWGTPEIFLPNVLLLLALYSWFYIIKPRQKKQQ